ncbi:WD40-repeat-containing domain protein, partial [Pyrenochaeta sp. MPI-SDFR-AT-0127]
IWDVESGVILQTLRGHSDRVTSSTFSHDSCLLASPSWDNTVKIWDPANGKCLQTFTTCNVPYRISFDTTGSYLHTTAGTLNLDLTRSGSASNITPKTKDTQDLEFRGFGLSADNWITYDSEKLICLSSEYQPSCSTVSGKRIAIGVKSGEICIISFIK